MEDHRPPTERNSTVAISATDAQRLERFCKSHQLSKKEFISASLTYFMREGIHPKTHESPHSELTKINKRIDQLFAFIKKQEQDLLKPLLLESVKGTEDQSRNFRIVLENQSKLQQTIINRSNSVIEEVQTNRSTFKETTEKSQKEQYHHHQELKKALQLLVQYMDEKNKKGLLGKLFD